MSDLVERLLALEATLANEEAETVQAAADEIARLRAVVTAAREECKEIIAHADSKLPSDDDHLDDELTGERAAAAEILRILDGEVKP